MKFGLGKLSVLLSTLAVLGATSAALFAPQFRVRDVRAEGGRTERHSLATERAWESLRAHAMFAGAVRLIRVSPDRVAEDIVQNVPWIETVEVRRRLPSTLVLNIQEKVPLAFLQVGERMYALDSRGSVIEEVRPEDALGSQLPIVRNERPSEAVAPGTAVVSTAVMDLLHEVVVLLPDRLGVGVAALIIPAAGAEEVHVRTDEGWLLLLDAKRNLPDQLRVFEHVVAEALTSEDRKRLEYVDLRVAGKVFYRLR